MSTGKVQSSLVQNGTLGCVLLLPSSEHVSSNMNSYPHMSLDV